MRRGIHTIRSGFTDEWPGSSLESAVRRYTLDNGDFELNMKLTDFEIWPISNSLGTADKNKLGSETIFYTISTTLAGAIPTSGSISEFEYGANYNLRPSDSRQIAWGVMAPTYGYVYSIIDPDHIIPEDVYILAWSLNADGTINYPSYPSGFMMKFEQVKSSGSEALLYQAKDDALED